MSVDRDRMRELFFAAVDLAPEAVASYLDEACEGDAELRAEVVSLLEFHDAAELIDEPADVVLSTVFGAAPKAVPAAPGAGHGARYRELSVLGVGGCGRVVRAYDGQLRRVVARKVVHAGRPDLERMLLQEARLLAYLDHPGVVQVFDGGRGAYTMRVLDGETLHERARRGPMAIGEVLRILTHVAETLANAHAKGVMHLDLKPANIMLQPFGQVSVIDWGLARFHDEGAYRAYLDAAGETAAPELAAWSGVAGTPSYMPVEQAMGGLLTPAADIFAFGTVLYELVAGELPFAPGPTPISVLAKGELTPRALATHRADVPARLDALCLSMLALEPADRPASFDEVLAELGALSGGIVVGEELLLATGEVLFRAGEPGAAAFQILSGSVRVTVDGSEGPTELARRGVGELIGELSVLSRAPRSATVTAIEPTRVAVVTPDRIEAELDKANPLLARMVRSLSDRLRQEAERVQAG